jgi:hypothetical protein
VGLYSEKLGTVVPTFVIAKNRAIRDVCFTATVDGSLLNILRLLAYTRYVHIQRLPMKGDEHPLL